MANKTPTHQEKPNSDRLKKVVKEELGLDEFSISGLDPKFKPYHAINQTMTKLTDDPILIEWPDLYDGWLCEFDPKTGAFTWRDHPRANRLTAGQKKGLEEDMVPHLRLHFPDSFDPPVQLRDKSKPDETPQDS